MRNDNSTKEMHPMNRVLTLLALAVLILAVSFVPQRTASADNQFWSEPCGNGQEIIIFGVSASHFQITVEIGTYNDQHYFYREYYGDPGPEFFGWQILPIKIGEINSWEHIKGLGMTSSGWSHVWIVCVDQDPDTDVFGPIYRGGL